jgi:uncharacterized membrane protein
LETDVLPPGGGGDALPAASPLPAIRRLALADLGAALAAGWRDFRAAPRFGLFFSAVYVVGGFLMVALGAGQLPWVLATSLGFPLVAPFAAAGLYEVSRRLEAGEPLSWGAVLGVVWRERTRQLPWAGAIIVLYFLFWTFLAHLLFALFMGPSRLTNITTSLDALWTREGLAMLAVQFAVGGALAFLLFALTVVSLPLLLHREVDFVTAMILSVRATAANPAVMAAWAVAIAALSLLALLPWFLGLVVVLPLLGHATWHLYRRALAHPGE